MIILLLHIIKILFILIILLLSFFYTVEVEKPNPILTTPPSHHEKQKISSVVLEDWQLSGRYKRKPISREEIEFINVRIIAIFYAYTIHSGI